MCGLQLHTQVFSNDHRSLLSNEERRRARVLEGDR